MSISPQGALEGMLGFRHQSFVGGVEWGSGGGCGWDGVGARVGGSGLGLGLGEGGLKGAFPFVQDNIDFVPFSAFVSSLGVLGSWCVRGTDFVGPIFGFPISGCGIWFWIGVHRGLGGSG